MEIKKILEAVCSPLGMDADEVFATLKGEKSDLELTDSTLTQLSESIKEQVVAARNESEKRFTRVAFEQYKKAARKLGVEIPKDTKDVDEVVNMIAEHAKESGDSEEGSKEITREVLLKHPVFKELKEEFTKKAADEYNKLQQEFEQHRKTEGMQILRTIAEKEVAEILESKRAILETETVKKSDRLAAIYKMLPWDQMRLEGGKPVLIDPETGDVLKDAFGKVVPLEKTVIEVASVFGFHKQDPSKGGSGGGRSGSEGGNTGKKYQFENQAAYEKAYSQATPAEKAQMSKDFFGLED